jgi:hypothetical protein
MLYVSNKFDIWRVGACNNKLFIEQEVVQYFVKAMRHYRDKEMLVVPFNTGKHWVTLSISTKYDQV